MIINKRTLRRINNLQDICEIDYRQQIGTINFKFKTTDEILAEDPTHTGQLIIRDSALDLMQNATEIIPGEFDIHYVMTIDDLQGHEPTTVLNRYSNAIEQKHRSVMQNQKKKNIILALMMPFSIFLLTLLSIGENRFGFNISGSIAVALVILLVALFSNIFFEAGLVLFRSAENPSEMFIRQLHRFRHFSVKNGQDKLLYSTDNDGFFGSWITVNIIERAAEKYILCFAVVLLSISIVQIAALFESQTSPNRAFILITLLLVFPNLLIGIADLSYYGDKMPLCESAPTLSRITTLCMPVLLGTAVLSGQLSMLSLIFGLIIFIGMICNTISLMLLNKDQSTLFRGFHG